MAPGLFTNPTPASSPSDDTPRRTRMWPTGALRVASWSLLELLFVGALLLALLTTLNYFGLVPVARVIPLFAALPSRNRMQPALLSGDRSSLGATLPVALPPPLLQTAHDVLQPTYQPPAAGGLSLSHSAPLAIYGWTHSTTVVTGEMVSGADQDTPSMLQLSVRVQQPVPESPSAAGQNTASVATSSAQAIFGRYFMIPAVATARWMCMQQSGASRPVVQCDVRVSSAQGQVTGRITQSSASQLLLLSACLIPRQSHPILDY